MDNNEQIEKIMAARGLSPRQVADILGVSPFTVVSWMRPATSKARRKAPRMALVALSALCPPDYPTAANQ